MLKEKYENKMKDILSDVSTYRKENKYLTLGLQTTVNRLVLKSFSSKLIDQKTKNLLIYYNGHAPLWIASLD